jgi:glyoxylase-like metal-dependent hydrolase (beta-lactamase superfamily II)
MSNTRAALPFKQVGGAYRRNVGAVRVATVHDGTLGASFDDVVGADPAACEAAHRAAQRSVPLRCSVNIFVVDTGDRLLLIDAGCGDSAPEAGLALQNLALLGIAPGDIDAVLMTHMHADHAAGLIGSDGSALFPRAELVLHEKELAFWSDSATLPRLRPSQHVDFAIAGQVFKAYADRMTTIGDNAAPHGLTAVPTPGHTPGHTAWLIDSQGERLLIWGDVVHFPAIQFAMPHASVRYDIDSAAAAIARRKVLDMVAAEALPVAGVHLDFPCYTHVRALPGGGFSCVGEIWTSDLPTA